MDPGNIIWKKFTLSLLNLHSAGNRIINMTNMIQFPSSLAASSLINKSSVKQRSTNDNSNLNEMFSSLISDCNSSFSTGEIGGSTGDMLQSLLMMMITKLFGADASSLNIKADIPQGTPLNGVLTQTSHDGHVALDFGVPVGTNVKTTMAGKVTYAGWNNEGYGNLVIVENGPYKTYYAHLSEIPVKVGQTVKEGDKIGLSGNTGNSTGPHLHYEIRKNGVAINPLSTIGK